MLRFLEIWKALASYEREENQLGILSKLWDDVALLQRGYRKQMLLNGLRHAESIINIVTYQD